MKHTLHNLLCLDYSVFQNEYWRRARKFIYIMNYTVILLLAVCMRVSATAYSQQVTIQVKNAKLENVFNQIREQTGYNFLYKNEVLQQTNPVSVNIRSKSVEEALNILFRGQGLTFTIWDKTILIKKTEERTPKIKEVNEVTQLKYDVTKLTNWQTMDDLVRKKINEPIETVVRGKVTDEKGEELPGVNIIQKGTLVGTTTNASGSFTLDVNNLPVTLVFSFVGYVTQEVPVTSQSVLSVVLKVDSKALEEVVVVGYGTQRKATVTGSVASIDGEQMKRNPGINLSNAISGLLPGAVSLGRTGEPGRDNANILIRGSSTTGDTSPLVVVDGVQGATGWQRINPNDIESISILKDASAAIYGARAANGVILITTKRGSTGKPVISYTFNQGFTQPTRVPVMASSASMAEYVNYINSRNGLAPRYTDAEIQKFRDGSDPAYLNVDWYSEVLKKTSTQNQHNLNVRGGSENVKYSVSGSYAGQNGMFKNGSLDFKTYAVRSNLDAKINDYLNVGFDLNAGLDNGNYPAFSTSSVFSRLRQLPTMPVYWPNGSPSSGIENGENPAVMVTEATGNTNEKKQRFQGKVNFDFKIPGVEGLGIDGYFAYQTENLFTKNWQTPWTVYDYDRAKDTYTSRTGGGLVSPQLTQSASAFQNTLVNLRFKYEKQFNDHFLSTFIAYEQIDEKTSNFMAFRRNYISSAIQELFAGSLIDQSTGGTSVETGRKNVFGRISYNFKEKYLVDFNARYDGSSAFPAGNRYGFFPGISAAWRISKEDFLIGNNFLNDLKARVSYGQIGNDRIAAFQNLTLFTLGNTGYPFGSTPNATQGLVAGVSPNPNITWEVATTYNVGLDGTIKRGLLGFSVDVFRQKRSNILTTRDLAIPFFTGLKLPTENIGVVENKGVEVQLSHKNSYRGVSFTIAGNVAYARNKVLDISEATNVPDWQRAEGHTLGAGLYYVNAGITRTQAAVDAAPTRVGMMVGDLAYEDLNGDGKIDAADRVRLDKSNIPQLTFGLNLSVAYKNFSIWANMAGAGRVWQYYQLSTRTGINQIADLVDNRYKPGSMDSKYPILPTVDTESEVSGLRSDFWLKNTSFARLKTLEISYSVPASVLSFAKIKSMRVFANGNNLFLIDKLKWFDPENSNENGSYYPQNRVFNLGVNFDL